MVYDRAHDSIRTCCADVQSYAAQMKGKTGLRRIINALGYSWDGIRAACDEAGFRQLLLLNGILTLSALLLPFALGVQLVLILASALSLVVELINTGIEAAVDHTSLAQHALAKRAKDVGSAAQYLLLAVLLLMWLLALWRTFAAT
ncbi:MAG: diacylglycerol kinase [Eikenella sp.]|nr:diacylglycerol kinase [Eikenella sp.]